MVLPLHGVKKQRQQCSEINKGPVMAPTLYMRHTSPFVRAVLMTAKAIELELNEKEIDTWNGEHLKPEFLKINPQHTIPTLVDADGFTVWDSHAIMAYLVSKYAKNDALYPKDLQKRATIDQRLYFESGVVFTALILVARPIFREGKTTIEQKGIDAAVEAYGFLEAFLDGREWVAGDSVTLADYSLISSITSLNVVVPLDAAQFPKVIAWIEKCEGLPEYEANKRGLREFSDAIKSKLASA